MKTLKNLKVINQIDGDDILPVRNLVYIKEIRTELGIKRIKALRKKIYVGGDEDADFRNDLTYSNFHRFDGQIDILKEIFNIGEKEIDVK